MSVMLSPECVEMGCSGLLSLSRHLIESFVRDGGAEGWNCLAVPIGFT